MELQSKKNETMAAPRRIDNPTWEAFRGDDDWCCYHWTTRGLELLLQKTPDNFVLDRNQLAREEFEHRKPEGTFLKENWWNDLLFPVVLVLCDENGQHPDFGQFALPGLLFWFKMRKVQKNVPIVRLREFHQIKHDDPFRGSINRGFDACGGGLLYVAPDRGLHFQHNPFEGASAGLTVAAYGAWYRRGVWPARPVAITGEIDEEGNVIGVDETGITHKLDGAIDRGVDVLITPGRPNKTAPEKLIYVPNEGAARRFNEWLKACEAALSRSPYNIELKPHPLLWQGWDQDTLSWFKKDKRGEVWLKYYNVLGHLAGNAARDADRAWRNFHGRDGAPHNETEHQYGDQDEFGDQDKFYWKHLFERDLQNFVVEPELFRGRGKAGPLCPPLCPPLLVATVGKAADGALPCLLDLKLQPQKTLWLCTDGDEGSWRDATRVVQRLIAHHNRPKDTFTTISGSTEEWLNNDKDGLNAVLKRLRVSNPESLKNIVVDITGGLRDNSFDLLRKVLKLSDDNLFPGFVTYVRSNYTGSSADPLSKKLVVLHDGSRTGS